MQDAVAIETAAAKGDTSSLGTPPEGVEEVPTTPAFKITPPVDDDPINLEGVRDVREAMRLKAAARAKKADQEQEAAMAAEREALEAARAASTTSVKRSLNDSDMNVLRQAMGLLIKQRGGGPFGSGRLPASELPTLEANLVELIKVLRADLTHVASRTDEEADQDDEIAKFLERRQPGEGLPSDAERAAQQREMMESQYGSSPNDSPKASRYMDALNQARAAQRGGSGDSYDDFD